jgi:nucleoside-diphosphate-sugar epimerase
VLPALRGDADKPVDVFVTGGSGYIGRNLIEALVARGDHVRALARSAESSGVVSARGAAVVNGDVLDELAMVEAMRGCDVVVHSAALLAGPRDESPYFRTNVGGTDAVLRAAERAGVPRLVHVSTEAVLADGRPMRNVDETHPYPRRHIRPYGITKAMAEQHVVAANSERLCTMAVRPRFVWGRDDSTLMPRLVAAARSGRLMWFDGGRYLTSTTHVANAVAGILAAAERGRGGEVYFVTDGEPVVFREFITALLATQGVAAPSRSVPLVVARAAATAMSRWAAMTRARHEPVLTPAALALVGQEVTVSDAKARRELGYQPVVSVIDGLADLRARYHAQGAAGA